MTTTTTAFTVRFDRPRRRAVIRVEGRLDATLAAQLYDELVYLIALGPRRIDVRVTRDAFAVPVASRLVRVAGDLARQADATLVLAHDVSLDERASA